jgi:alkanesulfonate monooxygenase SsuD/methylene tetrahydromethanopterin reductase-like flavin-dependent oxidoreductase (luciferase family)
MTTIGAVFLPEFAPEQLLPAAEAADAAGLAELWLWEDCFWQSGIAAAAAALARTERLRVGVGLLPVPLRNVAITAMEAATLEGMFPGRPLLGVGHGVQEWMGQVGARVESPVTLLREYLDALHALLAGEEVSTDGRYVKLDRVKLDRPTSPAPVVLAGATGPRTLKLVGGHADGSILVGGTKPAEVAEARALIEEGRAETGRTGPHRLTVYLPAVTGPDARARLEAQLPKWGMDSAEDRSAVGSAADVAAEVARWAEAGADSVVLQPLPDEPDPAAYATFAAEVGRAVAG